MKFKLFLLLLFAVTSIAKSQISKIVSNKVLEEYKQSEEKLVATVKSECIRNNGDISKVQKFDEMLKDCVLNNTHISDLNALDDQVPNEQYIFTVVMQMICRDEAASRQCMAEAEDVILPTCFSSEQREDIIQQRNAKINIFDYMCLNNEQNIKSFLSNGGLDCMKSQSEELASCVTEEIQSELKEFLENTANYYKNFKPFYCKFYENSSKCLVDALKKCSSPTPANFVGELLDRVYSSMECTPSSVHPTIGTNRIVNFKYLQAITPNKDIEDYNKLTEKIVNFVGSRCSVHHVDNSKIQKFQEMTRKCLQTINLLDSIPVKDDKLDEYENDKADVDFFCRNYIDVIRPCMAETSKIILPACFTSEEQEYITDVNNILKQIPDYMCLNNKKNAYDFILNDGIDCIESQILQLQSCFIKKEVVSAVQNSLETPNNYKLIKQLFCSVYEESSGCIVDVLKKCPSPRPAKHIGELMDRTNSALECPSSIKPLYIGLGVLAGIICILAIAACVVRNRRGNRKSAVRCVKAAFSVPYAASV